MKQHFNITGMTCDGCRRKVENILNEIPGVTHASVDLATASAAVEAGGSVSIQTIQQALAPKYSIDDSSGVSAPADATQAASKLRQLMPLLIILAGIATVSYFLVGSPWEFSTFMLNYMGLFFVVFSGFKLLDLKGFPPAFSMYDPLAKALPVYGWVYPFLELLLGVLFLMRIQLVPVLIITIVLLGITTIGVLGVLLSKRKIKCACLGTVLKLPMTEATFIENAIMIVMASLMLYNLVS